LKENILEFYKEFSPKDLVLGDGKREIIFVKKTHLRKEILSKSCFLNWLKGFFMRIFQKIRIQRKEKNYHIMKHSLEGNNNFTKIFLEENVKVSIFSFRFFGKDFFERKKSLKKFFSHFQNLLSLKKLFERIDFFLIN